MNDLLITDWLAWLEGGNAARSTLRLRRYTLAAFARTHDLTRATGRDVQDHLAELPGGPWSKASHLAALRSYYRWATLRSRRRGTA